MIATTTTPASPHRFAPRPAEPAHIDALLRAMVRGESHDDRELQYRTGLRGYDYTAALRDARAAGWVARWRKSEWYAGIWQLTDAGERLAEMEQEADMFEPRNAGEAREDAQRAYEDWMLEQMRMVRVEDNHDAEYGAEWRISEAEMLADVCETQRVQLMDYAATKGRLTAALFLLDDARREIAALRAESATLAAKLDAATAELSARENAEVLAESDWAARILRLNVDEMAPLEALTALLALHRDVRAAAPAPDVTTPAAVRMDSASLRQRVECPPPPRKPAA